MTKKQLIAQARLSIYKRAFEGLTKAQSNEVRSIIVKNIISKKTQKTTMNKLISLLKITPNQAERIVRTEEHEIATTLRETDFALRDPTEKNKYKWIGPSDHRTSAVCESIKRKTKKGVSMDKLKEIIQKETTRFNPKWTVKDWTPHPNCRHSFVRVFT